MNQKNLRNPNEQPVLYDSNQQKQSQGSKQTIQNPFAQAQNQQLTNNQDQQQLNQQYAQSTFSLNQPPTQAVLEPQQHFQPQNNQQSYQYGNQTNYNQNSNTGPFQYGQGQHYEQQRIYENTELMEELAQYNSDKNLLRTTTERIPYTHHLQKEIGIPIGIIVKPFGDLPSGDQIPTTSYGTKPIVRCRDCRGYINPFVRFIDGGQKWTCNFCGEINKTEEYYYSPLIKGKREDHEERNELQYGTVDFIASNEYMNRPPMPPTFVFVLDVSRPAIESGYLALAVQTIKNVIENQLLPGGERTRIAFITYDQGVHFYNLKSTLKQPQMFVVSDVEQMFLPQPEDLLVPLTDSYDIIMNLLENIPSFFEKSQITDNCFVPVLQAAVQICKPIGGKILFFQVSHSIVKHPMLAPKQVQSPDRIDLINPTVGFFGQYGSDLAHWQISCDMFVFTHGKNQYKNLVTFSDLAKKSQGNLYYYSDFNTRQHGLKFSNELYHNLTRKISWEGVFRIRVSSGFQQLASYGNIQIKNKTQDLVLCPTLDCDKVFTYEIERNDLFQEDPSKQGRRDQTHLYIQSALLYSTSEGERRIRVHNLAVPITNTKHLPFEYIDINAMTHYYTRIALNRMNTNVNFALCRGLIEGSLGNMCRNLQRSQQTIKQNLPDNIQYLVVYILGALKAPFLSPYKPIQVSDYLDQLCFLRFNVNQMSPEEILPLFSPQIIAIDNKNLNDQEFPFLESLDGTSLRQDGIYLCFNGWTIYFYVRSQCPQYFIQTIFKTAEIGYIDKQLSEEEIFADCASSQYLTALYNIINQFRYQRQPFCEIKILVEGDLETQFILSQMLILDNKNPSYPQDYNKFLNQITGGHQTPQQIGGAPPAYY